MKSNLPSLIMAMTAPGFYPHMPPTVELRQTHISYVLIAAPYVYKVKRAVKFPFVDYSTLQRRQHFCLEEIRLNRRLAPHTYMGVVGISSSDKTFTLEERSAGQGTIVEFAVKMHCLPEERILGELLVAGTFDHRYLPTLAGKLAVFHQQADRARASAHGSVQAITANVEANFRDTQPFIDFDRLTVVGILQLRDSGLRLGCLQESAVLFSPSVACRCR
ncbi:MAG TPA: hypothetical protein VMT22_08545 [Terriglobales bacterium]|jgi:aminoglycoside phosphotransferase family enzyme|nr:hypothetical protein [Terriglobales bacterium]